MVTMGFLARGLEPNDTYNRKSWAIACRLAEKQGCRLLMIAGSFLNAPDPRDRAHPAVFRLVGPGLIDRGLLSQTVINRATPEQLETLDRDLPGLPLVSFTIAVGRRPVVRVDNAPGLRVLLRHLIRDHGRRRIVHVRGPRPNAESAERERIWREELVAASIEPVPQWVVPGDFDYTGLQTIGQDIVDRVGRDFDAVVACNDLAALRVMADLQALGFRVPEEVVVCGFDDIQSGQYSRPSLTTVSQPLEEQTRLAWTLAETEAPEGTVTLFDSVAVYRASCSCGPDRWNPESFPLLSYQGDLPDLVSVYEARRETFQWAVYDLHNFLRDLNGILDPGQLPSVLETWLPRLGMASWAVLTSCGADGAPQVHVSAPVPGSVLPSAPDSFTVLTAFPDPRGFTGTRVSGRQFSLSPWIDGVPGRIHGLFPLVIGDLWYGLAVFELSAQAGLLELTVQEQLASVLDRLDRERSLRERIADSRSRAVAQEDSFRGLQRLVAEVAHELNTPLGAILSSVGFLESGRSEEAEARLSERFPWWRPHSPPQLPLPREQREKKHRMASLLEEAGISEPEAAADDLVDLGFPADPGALSTLVSQDQWRAAVTEMARITQQKRASWIVGEASRKLANYVAALRQTTRKLGMEDRVPCDLLSTVQTSWGLVSESVVHNIGVQWMVEPLPPVLGRPGELQQVWINLIRNGCQAMGWAGQLTVSVAPRDQGAMVEVADEGTGIPEELRDRVFTPFFTTKPEGEGMGLGLDICRRIVEGHGGSIGFVSRPGKTVFTVWLPVLRQP